MAEWNDCNLWSPRIEDFKKCQHIDSIYTLNWISLGFYLLQAWMYDIYNWKQMFLKTEHCVLNAIILWWFHLYRFVFICVTTIQTKKPPVLPSNFHQIAYINCIYKSIVLLMFCQITIFSPKKSDSSLQRAG